MKDELLKKLNSEDKNEVREAVEMLSDYEDPEVIKALVDTAISKKSKAVLEAVKNTLMSFSKEKEAICKEVLRLFDYPEPKLRQTAIDILSDKGNACIPAIRDKLMNHEDYNMRKFALDVLASIGTEEALEEVAKLLEDENPNVSMSALEYLRNFGEFQERVAQLIKGIIPRINDLYSLTTLASTVIYGKIREKSLIDPLKDLLSRTSDPMERHWIYKTLLFLGDREVVKDALENARSIGMEKDIEEDMRIFGV